jgi:hypothetical protein
MKIVGVEEIFDNGEFVTIVTKNCSIHLPSDGNHSIVLDGGELANGSYGIKSVGIDFYNE